MSIVLSYLGGLTETFTNRPAYPGVMSEEKTQKAPSFIGEYKFFEIRCSRPGYPEAFSRSRPRATKHFFHFRSIQRTARATRRPYYGGLPHPPGLPGGG